MRRFNIRKELKNCAIFGSNRRICVNILTSTTHAFFLSSCFADVPASNDGIPTSCIEQLLSVVDGYSIDTSSVQRLAHVTDRVRHSQTFLKSATSSATTSLVHPDRRIEQVPTSQ